MDVTWLGQAGFFFCTSSGYRIMIDPYLSDSMEKERGQAMKRLVPVNSSFLRQQIDVLFISHNHGDHLDFDTLDQMIPAQENPLTVLAPFSVWAAIRERYKGAHDYIMFRPGTEVTLENVSFRSVAAAHTDIHAVGVIFASDGLNIYVTGDTLFTKDIFEYMDAPIDYLFTVMNGAGNNMNAIDAARLTKLIKPKHAVPIHWDMFTDYAADPKHYLACMRDSRVHAFLLKQYETCCLE
jgi:L-ascorbate 6-phosphate lactonase